MTYEMTFDVYKNLSAFLQVQHSRSARQVSSLIDPWVEENYGLIFTPNSELRALYEVTDEKLFTLFLLRWS